LAIADFDCKATDARKKGGLGMLEEKSKKVLGLGGSSVEKSSGESEKPEEGANDSVKLIINLLSNTPFGIVQKCVRVAVMS
jgi:hypothetical protein